MVVSLPRRLGRRGQGSVEYMLVISVLVIAAVLVLTIFNQAFIEAMRELANRMETVYTNATITSPF